MFPLKFSLSLFHSLKHLFEKPANTKVRGVSTWWVVVQFHCVLSVTILSTSLVFLSSFISCFLTPFWNNISSLRRGWFLTMSRLRACYYCMCSTFHSPNRIETLFSSHHWERNSFWIEHHTERPWDYVIMQKFRFQYRRRMLLVCFPLT